jgi:hypothetical protein
MLSIRGVSPQLSLPPGRREPETSLADPSTLVRPCKRHAGRNGRPNRLACGQPARLHWSAGERRPTRGDTMSTLTMALAAALVAGSAPEKVSGETRQFLDLPGNWKGTLHYKGMVLPVKVEWGKPGLVEGKVGSNSALSRNKFKEEKKASAWLKPSSAASPACTRWTATGPSCGPARTEGSREPSAAARLRCLEFPTKSGHRVNGYPACSNSCGET